MQQSSEPYTHYVIDNFVEEDYALELSKEFMDYNSPNWYVYNNDLEIKKSCNNWFHFPPETYNFFQALNSPKFLKELRNITGLHLIPDHGLHGAGWHIQGNGSRLNVHLDYSLHPKLNLERKINFIYYLTPEWKPEYGGNLELWSHDEETNQPKELVKTIENKFNRLVLFDASQNSWHGFSQTIDCPPNIYRKSIAMYYLVQPTEKTNKRARALYAPTQEQKSDPKVLKLIEDRVKL